jgi:hypothetical protein
LTDTLEERGEIADREIVPEIRRKQWRVVVAELGGVPDEAPGQAAPQNSKRQQEESAVAACPDDDGRLDARRRADGSLPGIVPGEGLEGGAIGLAFEALPEVGDRIEPIVDGQLHAGAGRRGRGRPRDH